MVAEVPQVWNTSEKTADVVDRKLILESQPVADAGPSILPGLLSTASQSWTLPELPSTSAVARSMQAQPADLLERIRQRAAVNIHKSARSGQLGVLLQAAKGSQVIIDVDKAMQEDTVLTDEGVLLPCAAIDVEHSVGVEPKSDGSESVSVVEDASTVHLPA